LGFKISEGIPGTALGIDKLNTGVFSNSAWSS